jgi:hypothetical protein
VCVHVCEYVYVICVLLEPQHAYNKMFVNVLTCVHRCVWMCVCNYMLLRFKSGKSVRVYVGKSIMFAPEFFCLYVYVYVKKRCVYVRVNVGGMHTRTRMCFHVCLCMYHVFLCMCVPACIMCALYVYLHLYV